jgi:SRSO17 transposase
MLTAAFAAGVPCRWVTGDSVDGADYSLRRSIERNGRGYCPGGDPHAAAGVQDGGGLGGGRAAQHLAAAERRRWGKGAAALCDWAYLPCSWLEAACGWQKGLLIRRKLAQPEAFTFYLTLAPETAGLSDLVRVAGTRWTIEACFEAAKGEVGLDQYEVRLGTGRHRHITLAMLAHAYLAVRCCAAGGEKRRGRSHRRSAAAHCARTAPSAVASGLGPTA